MECKGSLLHSQVPTTCPSLEPARSSPYFHIPHLPSGLFPSGFPNKTLYMPLLSPIHAMCPVHLILLNFITRKIMGEEHRSLSSSLCSFLYYCYLVPCMPKYSSQHPILKHPQPTFLTQCEGTSFTPIENNRQNYSSVYLNL